MHCNPRFREKIVHSSKSHGYGLVFDILSFDDSENSEMAIRALEMACRKTGYLPREIVTDNSSAYRKAEYQKIQGAGTIKHKGKELTYSQASKLLLDPNRALRKEIFLKV